MVLVGADGVSYGARVVNSTYREWLMGEVGPTLDASRVHFPGRLDYDAYVRLLQRSDAHVYLTYPFVASWSLREALACGCAIVASDTAPVQEFVQHGATGLLTPFLDPAALADAILGVLADDARTAWLRAGARAYAVANLRMRDHLVAYYDLINRLTGGQLGAPFT